MGNSTEGEDTFEIWHRADFCCEEWTTGIDFCADRLVLWRHTTNSVGHSAIDEFKAIIGM